MRSSPGTPVQILSSPFLGFTLAIRRGHTDGPRTSAARGVNAGYLGNIPQKDARGRPAPGKVGVGAMAPRRERSPFGQYSRLYRSIGSAVMRQDPSPPPSPSVSPRSEPMA